MRTIGSLRVGRTCKHREAVSQANTPEERPVDPRGITAKTEEDEQHVPSRNWSPAVKEDLPLGWILGYLIPLWSMHSIP